ncbi:MAG: NUDIX domain-containing protein [Anaerolineales bacterium]|nr:NUDIX domain-containing protein [Anaerolineales bacterium]
MQTQVLYGNRLGRQGNLRIGCSATIFDRLRQKVLFTLRADNGKWCLPGGMVEPGESVEEACLREIFEETGLEVVVKRLVGVYSNPDQLVIYPDGNKAHFIVLNFEAEITNGEPRLSNETTDVRFFTPQELDALEIHAHHDDRVRDTLAGQPAAFIR